MLKNRGLTLVELLVAMAVIMILTSIGTQAYSALLSQQALLSSSEQLYQFLRLAKSSSIKYNKKVYVHFCQQGSSTQWAMALSEQPACDCFTNNSCLVNGNENIELLSDGNEVHILPSDITFSGQQASYSPMRFAVNSGSITLSDKSGYQLKVIQSIMRLKICSPDSAQLGYKKC